MVLSALAPLGEGGDRKAVGEGDSRHHVDWISSNLLIQQPWGQACCPLRLAASPMLIQAAKATYS